MESQPGDSLKASWKSDRSDRSILALLEIGAAGVLFGSFLVPWYAAISDPNFTGWIPWGGSAGSITLPDLLIPFATLVAVVVSLAGLVFPGRGAKIAILVAFAAACYGAILRFQELSAGDLFTYRVPPNPGPGIWLFTGASAAGALLAVVDLVRGGNSTFLWRAIGRPSMRRYGTWVAYGVMLLVTLPVVLFPLFPQWWLFVWLAALLMGPLWVARARMAR